MPPSSSPKPPPSRDAPSSNVDLAFPSATAVYRGKRIVYYLAAASLSALVGLSLTCYPPILVVGGLIGIAGGITILLRPYIGVLLYMVAFLLRPGVMYPVLATLHLERIIGVVTLVAMFLQIFKREGTISVDNSTQTRWYLAFIAAVALSIPFSYWRASSVETLVDMLQILAFYLMIVHLVDSRRRVNVFLWLYLGLVVFLGVDSLRTYFAGESRVAQGVYRASTDGKAGGFNELGTTMASTIPLVLLLIVAETSIRKRILLGSGLGVCLWVMVLTGSRASMLGFLAGMAYLWWKSKKRLLLGVVAVFVIVAGYYAMPEQYQGRYATITSQELDGSSKARLVSWTTGMKMFVDRPLFGVGAGCFGAARSVDYSLGGPRSYEASHSLYIQVMSELGVVGIVTFTGLVFSFLRLNRRVARRILSLGAGWRKEHWIVTALFAGFVVLLVSGVFGHSLYRRTWCVFAALGLAIYRIHSEAHGTREAN